MLVGPPEVGKTSLLHNAVEGFNYSALIDLIASLEEAQAAGYLRRRLAVLTHPSLLVMDETGGTGYATLCNVQTVCEENVSLGDRQAAQ